MLIFWYEQVGKYYPALGSVLTYFFQVTLHLRIIKELKKHVKSNRKMSKSGGKLAGVQQRARGKFFLIVTMSKIKIEQL